MAKSTLLCPQFFHTLVPGFDTHLTIPLDFFSKYIEGNVVGKKTAEMKSDASDITWKVKVSGRRLGDGWEDFAVANNLGTGHVVLVRYEGDSVFHVSDLGSNCCEIQDIPPPGNNNDGRDDVGKTLFKKRLYPKTQVYISPNDGDDEDKMEFPRKKKVKKNSQEAEVKAVSSSSSEDSCFVAVVTASSLRTDKLYLPQHITSSNGLTRKCRKIVLMDGGKRSWALELRFNESSDTFYVTRGWRNFCEENGKEAGDFFMFKLVGNGETTPVLSFGCTESYSDKRQRDRSRESPSTEFSSEENNIEWESNEDDCNSMESLMEIGKKKCSPKELSSEEENIEGESSEEEWSSMESLMEIEKKKYRPKRIPYSSYLPCHTQFVTFTLPPDYDRIGKLCLPVPFVRENSLNKPGMIYLSGKYGTKWLTNLQQDKKGTMSLGKGWKKFVKANGLELGFALKLIWEDTTPVLSLCCAESTRDREQEEYFKAIKKQSLFIDPSSRGKISRDKNNKEESRSWKRNRNHLSGRGSTPSSQKQLVTLTITPSSFIQCRLVFPAKFARENSMNKPGMIYLSGKDGTKWLTNLQQDKNGRMSLGKGWKDFVKANNLKSGESFTMELIREEATPVLKLVRTESSSSKDNEKESVSTEPGSRYSSPAIQHRFVTLTLTPEDVEPILPSQFMKANGINKLGKITFLGENKMEWSAYLLTRDGLVALGNGWIEFCEANGVKIGESFTLEFISEQDKTNTCT